MFTKDADQNKFPSRTPLVKVFRVRVRCAQKACLRARRRLRTHPSTPHLRSFPAAPRAQSVPQRSAERGWGGVSGVFKSEAYRCLVRPASRQVGLYLALSQDFEPTCLSQTKQ